MSRIPSKRLLPRAVIVGAMCLVAAAASPAVSPGANTIHLEVAEGPHAGTYDLTTSEPCQVGIMGANDWRILVFASGANPDRFRLEVRPDYVSPGWIDFSFLPDGTLNGKFYQKGAGAQPDEATVDDRGDTATLTVVAVAGTITPDGKDLWTPVSATVECRFIQRLHEPSGPVPSIGPAPSLAASLH